MSDDTISRQAAIDTIQDAFELATNDVEKNTAVYGICEGVTGICKAMVMQLPTAEPQWIPCSERLPEINKYVLVSFEGGIEVDKLRKYKGVYHWQIISEIDMKHDAWMPLPEPYKEDKA